MLDPESPGGIDHRTPLYRSELFTNEDVAYAAHGFWGAFATWEDRRQYGGYSRPRGVRRIPPRGLLPSPMATPPTAASWRSAWN